MQLWLFPKDLSSVDWNRYGWTYLELGDLSQKEKLVPLPQQHQPLT